MKKQEISDMDGDPAAQAQAMAEGRKIPGINTTKGGYRRIALWWLYAVARRIEELEREVVKLKIENNSLHVEIEEMIRDRYDDDIDSEYDLFND